MGQNGRGSMPVFFTLRNQRRSIEVLENLRMLPGSPHGVAVFDSQADLNEFLVTLDDSRVPIGLFDSDIRVNHWRPQMPTEPDTPGWVLGSKWCARVSARGVASPQRVLRCARQIKILFEKCLKDGHLKGIQNGDLPWGPRPKERKRSTRNSHRGRAPRWTLAY